MSTLELAANAMMTIAIILAGRNNIHSWWTGIVGCLLFAILFYGSQLYADVALQAFFIASNCLGWWQWLRGAEGKPLPVTRVRLPTVAWMMPIGVLATGAYGWMLHRFTNAYAPFIDSAVLVFSIFAQLLMMRRKLENWLVWIAVNGVAVPLYLSRGLHLTAALYAFYFCYAIYSWRLWRKLALVDAPAVLVPERQ
ncbi:nicotinamide riboside transporter PnuC [Massilia sp. TS11]|uniref:nicotinamide riboside transporter PnuC n=1 Tax=Massilia sp. TS11 TaxID=2908003 RepID=UPI001EDA82AD|nr:nicotinamide riboside transporter PnuC [Massilia sp. TS11]MCG2584218.1 nicotinamide riboside transporter PnuC [Massilia sp. TS11]